MKEGPDHLPAQDNKGFDESFLDSFEISEISEAAPVLLALAKKILEGGHTYDLIISDDASARLVSLFVKGVVDGVQKKRGEKKTAMRFIASGRYRREGHSWHNEAEELLKGALGTRALLVTEAIDSGGSIKRLMHVLENIHATFDIATLSGSEAGIDYIEGILKRDHAESDLFSGEVGFFTGNVFHTAWQLNGIETSADSAIPKRSISGFADQESKKETQEFINQARKEIKLLVEETVRLLSRKE